MDQEHKESHTVSMQSDNGENNKIDHILAVQSHLLQADFDLDNFMDLVVSEVQVLTGAHTVVIELVQGDEMVYRSGIGGVEHHMGLRLPISKSISGMCVTLNQVLRSDDTENDSRVNLEACRKVKARSLVVAPLFKQRKAIGVLKILADTPSAFTDEDVKILQLMAGFLGSALGNQLEQEIRNFF